MKTSDKADCTPGNSCAKQLNETQIFDTKEQLPNDQPNPPLHLLLPQSDAADGAVPPPPSHNYNQIIDPLEAYVPYYEDNNEVGGNVSNSPTESNINNIDSGPDGNIKGNHATSDIDNASDQSSNPTGSDRGSSDGSTENNVGPDNGNNANEVFSDENRADIGSKNKIAEDTKSTAHPNNDGNHIGSSMPLSSVNSTDKVLLNFNGINPIKHEENQNTTLTPTLFKSMVKKNHMFKFYNSSTVNINNEFITTEFPFVNNSNSESDNKVTSLIDQNILKPTTPPVDNHVLEVDGKSTVISPISQSPISQSTKGKVSTTSPIVLTASTKVLKFKNSTITAFVSPSPTSVSSSSTTSSVTPGLQNGSNDRNVTTGLLYLNVSKVPIPILVTPPIAAVITSQSVSLQLNTTIKSQSTDKSTAQPQILKSSPHKKSSSILTTTFKAPTPNQISQSRGDNNNDGNVTKTIDPPNNKDSIKVPSTTPVVSVHDKSGLAEGNKTTVKTIDVANGVASHPHLVTDIPEKNGTFGKPNDTFSGDYIITGDKQLKAEAGEAAYIVPAVISLLIIIAAVAAALFYIKFYHKRIFRRSFKNMEKDEEMTLDIYSTTMDFMKKKTDKNRDSDETIPLTKFSDKINIPYEEIVQVDFEPSSTSLLHTDVNMNHQNKHINSLPVKANTSEITLVENDLYVESAARGNMSSSLNSSSLSMEVRHDSENEDNTDPISDTTDQRYVKREDDPYSLHLFITQQPPPTSNHTDLIPTQTTLAMPSSTNSGMSNLNTDGHVGGACNLPQGPNWRPFHPYDPVYVPTSNASAMNRLVDSTGYVSRPRRPESPTIVYEEINYEGVSFGVRRKDTGAPSNTPPPPLKPRVTLCSTSGGDAGNSAHRPPPLVPRMVTMTTMTNTSPRMYSRILPVPPSLEAENSIEMGATENSSPSMHSRVLPVPPNSVEMESLITTEQAANGGIAGLHENYSQLDKPITMGATASGGTRPFHRILPSPPISNHEATASGGTKSFNRTLPLTPDSNNEAMGATASGGIRPFHRMLPLLPDINDSMNPTAMNCVVTTTSAFSLVTPLITPQSSAIIDTSTSVQDLVQYSDIETIKAKADPSSVQDLVQYSDIDNLKAAADTSSIIRSPSVSNSEGQGHNRLSINIPNRTSQASSGTSREEMYEVVDFDTK